MKLQVVSFDLAKKLHEVDFVGYKSNRFYYKDGSVQKCHERNSTDWTQWKWTDGIRFVCPFQGEVQRWLREEHNLIVEVHSQYMPNSKYKFGVKVKNNFFDSYNTYEEALEVGLKEAIKLL